MSTTVRRRLLILAFALLIIALIAGAGGYLVLRSSLPRADGAVRLAGLSGEVAIARDRFGIPHVTAGSIDDLFFAIGYLQAQDRLWQMELYRRTAAGRLSELLGDAMVGVDKQYLTLGLHRAAAAETARLSTGARRILDRYAAGVNARITSEAWWALAPEFAILRHRPEPWTPTDSIAISKLMAWRLCENHRGELMRARLIKRFGPAEAATLMSGYPAGAPLIIPPEVVRYSGVRLPALAADAWPVDDHGQRGSNSWVVGPARSASGRALLANDPHLGIEMPSIWYEEQLAVPSAGAALPIDVAGVAIPGLPLVVIGHNRRIAWGLTNTGADVQDLYVERIDPVSERYLYQGRWLPLKVTREEIAVRGRKQPVAFDVKETRHGPIFTELNGQALALRWDPLEQGDITDAFWRIDTAGNWDQFLAGVREFAAPSQNIVYADVDGNIGYVPSGRVPVRSKGNGSVPVPGWTGEYEWIGYIPADRMPMVFNPPSHTVVTANNRIVDDRYPFHLTSDWIAPFRAARITRLLAEREKFDVIDIARVQGDVESAEADYVLEPLDRSIPASRAENRAEREAVARVLDRLRLWGRRVDGGSTAALYEVYRSRLWRRTFADEMDEELFRQYVDYMGEHRLGGLYAILDDPRAHWWDDIGTIDHIETREDIEALAASDALAWLKRRFDDPGSWRWDAIHGAPFLHVLGRQGGPLAWLFSRGPVPLGGDGATVNNAAFAEGRRPDDRMPFRVTAASSYRQVLDVGDWDRSIAVNTTGESGHPLSSHYFDQNPLWRDARYHPLPFSRVAVERETVSRLTLKPR